MKLKNNFFLTIFRFGFGFGFSSLIMLLCLMAIEKSTLICRYTPANNSSLCRFEKQPLLWRSKETNFFKLSEIETVVRGRRARVNILILKTNQGNFSTDYDLDVIEPINNFINEPSKYPYLNLQLNSKSIHVNLSVLVSMSFGSGVLMFLGLD